MKSLMTPHHIRSLKFLVQEYLQLHHNEVDFEELGKYVNENDFRTADSSMFREWVLENFPNCKEKECK